MTDLVCQRLATAALGFLLLAATTTSADAQIRIDRDQTGRIVAMANLSATGGCARASGRGRVVQQHFENGQMKGVTFKDAKHGESYLNLPYLGTISPASARTRVAEGFATLLVPGQELKVVTLGCGAAGRIEKLASVELVDPPARSAGAGTANGPARSPAAAAAFSDTGARPEDNDSVLRTPDGPAAASAAPQRQAPPPLAPQPAPQRQASSKPAGDDEGVWNFSTYGRKAKLGIADGNHFTTLMLDCAQGSGRTTILADDPQGKYRRGSRQTFRITSGEHVVAVTGKAIYNDMDSAMQIEATVELEPLRDVLSEIARHSRFVIRTPGGSQPVDIRGAGAAIPKFLAACGRRR